MIHQFTRTANRFILGALILSFTVVACNSKKSDKKETIKEDTATKMEEVKPMQPIDTAHMDTADTRPVKTPD